MSGEHQSFRAAGYVALSAASCLIVATIAYAQESAEVQERMQLAASNMEDAVVVDCQLPGKLRRLGGTKTYLTPGRLVRMSAIGCRTRGGEYTLGDLASGTLSLQRWLDPAESGDETAQYYVARIYATGMDDVPVDYSEAARWYQLSADQGNVEALQELGFLYEQGLGVDKDVLKALNLQREASGLGDELDYAFKIDEAQARVADLERQLDTTNAVVRQAQLEARDSEARYENALARSRELEVRIAGLTAELDTVNERPAGPSDSRAQQLESELRDAREQLQAGETEVASLQAKLELARQSLQAGLAGGQAAKLELRELRARAEQGEQQVGSLSAELAEAEQRLIQSEEEIRALRAGLREQSAQITLERQRMLEAGKKTDSEAAALLAVKEAELVSKSARIATLEKALANVNAQLNREEEESAQIPALRQQLSELQARHDAEVAAMAAEQARVEEIRSATESELEAIVLESRSTMAARDAEIDAQKREIDRLNAEAGRLKSRVDSLQAERTAQAEASNQSEASLRARLQTAKQEAVALRSLHEAAKTEKSMLEAKLSKLELELQQQTRAQADAEDRRIQLLEADTQAAKSTIRAQSLRIAELQEQIEARDVQIADLRAQVSMPEVLPVEVSNAMAVLELARSNDGPNLGRFRALLIANEQYQHLPPLTTPVRDAREIERLLQRRYGFRTEILVNATDDQVMRKLHEYANTLTEEDNLLIYYAGRGSTPDGPPDRAYWLGVDADPSLPNTWLLAEHVSDKIREISAKRILLVTDSCFSRRSLRPVTTSVGMGLEPERFRLLTRFQARYVLTSGANVPVFDERGDKTHSLFAKYFMEILRQNSNVLSGEMLSYEMRQRVQETVSDAERALPAYSSLQGAGHKAGDFFFVPRTEMELVARVGTGPDNAGNL